MAAKSSCLLRASDAISSTVLNNSGVIRATSLDGKTGSVQVDGGAAGIVSITGVIDASGRAAGQTGGTVKVLGEKIALSGSASVYVAGDTGGGTALIGGNYQGKGAEANATAVYIGKDAKISAGALTNGSGGKVIVWSNEATRFYGDISAKGGASSGNGGFVETSGKEYLDAQGKVDASAAKGAAGQWLLDAAQCYHSGAKRGRRYRV